MSHLRLTLGHPDGDLIIRGRPDLSLGHGAWLTKLVLPDRTWRRKYAPASNDLPGQILLAATIESAALTALVSIKAATSEDLGIQLGHLEDVCSQFSYSLMTRTETRDQTWAAEPADITYGEYAVSADRMAGIQIGLSIPISPS